MNTKDDTYKAFTNLYGRAPIGIWSAPGRANLIGEHTDYNDGLALPFAINYRTFAAVAPRTDRLVRVWSREEPSDPIEWKLDDPSPTKRGWASYPLGVVSLMVNDAASGIDIAISSDVPVGAGLSSSAALECAMAVAVRDLWNTGHSDTELAALGALAENDIVGAPTGTMDQLASMLGIKNKALAIDFYTRHTQQVPLNVEDHDLSIIIVDSGQRHDHATGGYGQRRAVCNSVRAELDISSLREISPDTLPFARENLNDEQARLLTHVVEENERVSVTVRALEDANFATVGDLLTASHRSLRDHFHVSTDYIDSLVDALLAEGALGARLCGGGFGGSVIALMPSEKVAQAEDEVTSMSPASDVLHAPTFRKVTPDEGAGRS